MMGIMHAILSYQSWVNCRLTVEDCSKTKLIVEIMFFTKCTIGSSRDILVNGPLCSGVAFQLSHKIDIQLTISGLPKVCSKSRW